MKPENEPLQPDDVLVRRIADRAVPPDSEAVRRCVVHAAQARARGNARRLRMRVALAVTTGCVALLLLLALPWHETERAPASTAATDGTRPIAPPDRATLAQIDARLDAVRARLTREPGAVQAPLPSPVGAAEPLTHRARTLKATILDDLT